MHNFSTDRPLTLRDFAQMKSDGQKIACLTAYDASFAALEDQCGVDVILVGDSLGMVVQGHDTTVPVTVDDIIYHSRAVTRATKHAFVIADMPFLSYSTRETALHHAARLMQEGGAKMVKLEGGAIQADIVRFMTERGIPVCGHIGLQPQLVHKLGGFRVQGRDSAMAEQMKADARALVEAGADMLLVECVPTALGAEITTASPVAVIGIGAGPQVDGQILVMHDMLGLGGTGGGRRPRFVQDFLRTGGDLAGAMRDYVSAVKGGAYPLPEHCF